MTVMINGVQARIDETGLEWTLDKLLKGAGAGANPTEIAVPAATKEFFVPAIYGSDPQAIGDGAGYLVNAAADEAYIVFKVPADFSSITTAEVKGIVALTNAAATGNINSDYYADAEVYTTHSESNETSTYNLTINKDCGIDISGILSSLAAGDNVLIRVGCRDATFRVYIMGVWFKYS